jgi:hypothetical protein
MGPVAGSGYNQSIDARALECQIGKGGARRDTIASRCKVSPDDTSRAETQKYGGDVAIAAELMANVQGSDVRKNLRNRRAR